MMQFPSQAAERVDLQRTLEPVLRNAVRALGGGAAAAATWDEVARRFTISAAYGVDAAALARLGPLLDEAIPDLAGSWEQFDLLSELGTHGSLPVSRQGDPQNPILALPLRIGGSTIGLIFVLRPSGSATFTKLDPPVLAAFAEQAAIAVYHARLAHMLAQEKRRLEAMVEGSADGIYTVDAHRRITAVNSAMERLLARPKEELIGQRCAQVMDLRDREGRRVCHYRCPLTSAPGNHASTVELHGTLRSSEGRQVEVEAVYSVVRSPEGRPLNAVVNVRDVSKVREMENLRSVFLSMLGHELQTPISIIKGYANTLARGHGNWDEAALRQSLEAIEEEGDRLSQLMNRLLLASRLETGAIAVQKEPVQLMLLARRVVRRARALKAKHRFSVNFPPEFPPVSGDPALLEEVLVNLVDNAVKYSPEQGMIRITGGVADGEARVTVADQGVGIPRWEIPGILERFRRGEHPLTRQTRGMGLGLYICNSIVAAHGGRIHVASEPGKGSQFTFSLPIE